MQITFEEACNQYFKYVDIELKEQSKRAVKDRIKNHILPYFKDFILSDITINKYSEWKNIIDSKNYSFKYKQTLHTAFVTFLNYCIKYHNLDKNVASIVGNFKNKGYLKKEFDYYTISEFKKFIKYVDNNIYKQFFNLMFYTGVRPGEAMALKFSDLNKGFISINKTISERNNHLTKTRTITSPKTISSIRDIQIDKKLNSDLLKLKKFYEKKYNNIGYDYYIFGGIKPLSTTTINRHMLKSCKLANLKKIRLHDFRHSHATLLLQKKVYLKEISRRLGHSKTSTTLDIYVHTNKKQEKKVIKTLNFLRLF